MRLALLIAAAAATLSTPAFAKCDLQGNCYNVTEDGAGGYNVRGFSLNNGSSWNQKIDQNGNQRKMSAGESIMPPKYPPRQCKTY